MNVHNIVEQTVHKYGTRSPYEMAERMGIIVQKNNLGAIRGYYFKKYRIKQIILHNDLSESDERFVLAHEIGHAVLHEDVNTPFLMGNTLFSKNKFEKEANLFAIELLVSDETIIENPDLTLEQLARMTGYQEELLRCKGIIHKMRDDNEICM